MTYHITPINDLRPHTEETTCACSPTISWEDGHMIVTHYAWDQRDMYERRATPVTARNGDILFVGDIIENVQGNRFLVVYFRGQFCIEFNGELWELEPYMSPNIWVIGNMSDEQLLKTIR